MLNIPQLPTTVQKLAKSIGIRPSYITEQELLRCLQEGRFKFRGKVFSRISLGNYPHIDIRGADISRLIDLPHILREFDCSGCVLRGAKLSGANIANARLTRADLRQVDLTQANLAGASLNKALLEDANLSYAILDHANCQKANFKRANLFEARSIGGNFKNAIFAGANTRRFLLDGAKYRPDKPDTTKKITWTQIGIAASGAAVLLFITFKGLAPKEDAFRPPGGNSHLVSRSVIVEKAMRGGAVW